MIDFMMTRYTCCLIAWNGDTQNCFAIQACKYSIIEKWERITNNLSVCKLLHGCGIKFEELPPEKDVKKLARRVKSEDRKFVNNPEKLKSEEDESY